MVLTTLSSGIFFLKSLVTGHSSLGSLRKPGPICQGVFLPKSEAVQDDLVGKSAGFRGQQCVAEAQNPFRETLLSILGTY